MSSQLAIHLSPTSLTFPNTRLESQSLPQAVTLTNTGYDDVTINKVIVVGDFIDLSPDFEVIKPGESVQLWVAFRPYQIGQLSGGLYIDTGDAAGQEFVSLSGSCVPNGGTLPVEETEAFIYQIGDPRWMPRTEAGQIIDGRIVESVDLLVPAAIEAAGALRAANNLNDVGNKATARTNLGVEIGKDVQAYAPLLGSSFKDKTEASATSIPAEVHTLELRGLDSETDAKGGQWVDDPLKGSGDSFTTNAGTRTWYRMRDVDTSRIANGFAAQIQMPSRSSFNVFRDSRLSAPIAKLIRNTGDATYNTLYGVQREIQSFAIDEVNAKIYTLHENDQVPNLAIVTRYPLTGLMDKQQDAVSLPGQYFGHQGLAVEYLSGGAVKLWSTYAQNKNQAMRCDFVDGGDPANRQLFTLFETPRFNSDVSCTVNLSYDQRFVLGIGLVVGEQKMICRIWDKAAMLAAGPGDHTKTFLYEWDMGAVYVPSTFPVQGIASDGETVVAWSGGNGYTVEPRRMYRYEIRTGKILEADHNCSVGSAESAGDGTGISYEPEGIQVMRNGVGELVYVVGVRSGSSLTPSVFRLHALGIANNGGTTIFAAKQSGVVTRFLRSAGAVFADIGNIFINTAALAIRAVGTDVNLRFGTSDTDKWEIADSNGGFRPMGTDTYPIGQSSRRVSEVWTKQVMLGADFIVGQSAGDPNGVVSAIGGSILLTPGGGPGTAGYIKEAGAVGSPTNTAWRAIQVVRAGSTAGRPTSAPQGWRYYDTTLNKPIWQSSATPTSPVWKDAMGTNV